MPRTASRPNDDPILAAPAAPESAWSGELHGSVAAMHREIEQRLLAGVDRMAVVPLPTRPGDALVAAVSRLGGWAVFGVALAATLALLLR